MILNITQTIQNVETKIDRHTKKVRIIIVNPKIFQALYL